MRSRAQSRWLARSLAGGALAFASCGGLDEGQINVVGGGGNQPTAGSRTGGGRAGGDSGSAGKGQGGSGTEGGQAGEAGAAGDTANANGGSSSGVGGAEGGAPEVNGGSDGGAGAPGAGGSGPAAGGSAGDGQEGATAGSAGDGGESGADPGGCAAHGECPESTPICEPPACRECASDPECEERDANVPVCASDGTCVECEESTDCPSTQPVCDEGLCRDCFVHSECETMACDLAEGTCASPSAIVYALAVDGSISPTCGSFDSPCASLDDAVDKLSVARPFLVLIPTGTSFSESVTLPNVPDLTIVGNDVRHAPDTGDYVFNVTGGSVSFDGLLLLLDTPDYPAGITCLGSDVTITQTQISGAAVGVGAYECNLFVFDSLFNNNSGTAIADCYGEAECPDDPSYEFVVERSEFRDNLSAINFQGGSYRFVNNIFRDNGFEDYASTVTIRSHEDPGLFAYNTVVGNENGCSAVGIVACAGGAEFCGTFSSNLAWDNNLVIGCPSQTFYSPPEIANTLAEEVWTGPGNVSGDPDFTDSTSFEPGPDSAALSGGDDDPSIMPSVDYYGRSRPRGDGPEMGAVEAD